MNPLMPIIIATFQNYSDIKTMTLALDINHLHHCFVDYHWQRKTVNHQRKSLQCETPVLPIVINTFKVVTFFTGMVYPSTKTELGL